MGRITSDIGLATGVNIKDTVDKLIALQAQTKTRLETRQKGVGVLQGVITDLTASTLGVQLAVRRLNSATLFNQKIATSSDTTAVTAKASSSVANGTYSVTTVRQVATHQLQSTGYSSADALVGAGTLSVRLGGFADTPQLLDELNSGLGVARGKIEIVDRDGTSTEIDLTTATTIDDVLTAINTTADNRVRAEVVGDALRLTDLTGGGGNLKVLEVAGGTTAADLGLGGIDAAATTATGSDVLQLFSGLSLQSLNDGNGVSIREGVADLQVTFRDGSSPLSIDFHKLGHGEQQATATTTAANGLNAQVQFTAVAEGETYDGVQIIFQDNNSITQGNETVSYDSNAKTLTFQIDAGSTTADDVIAALNDDPTASDVFTAARFTGSDGSGLIAVADTATTADGGETADHIEKTLGDLVETINAASPTRLQATISGDRLVLTDLTTNNGGTFSVVSTTGGTVAHDLGLTGTASGGTLTGGRLLGGLKSTLLRSLNGGQGLETLGSISITNRNGGGPTAVNLANAETLDDVIEAINAAGAGVTASYNSARNGIQIVDTSGGTGSLIIANGDANNTAEKLQIEVNAAVESVNSGSLNRQNVHENTQLSSLNGGRGVNRSTILITNSAGVSKSLRLSTLQPDTVGDVIDAINSLDFTVTARINDAGDGIVLIDSANGSGTLSVADSGTGTAAKDLRILGNGTATTISGQPRQIINGSTTYTIDIDAEDTLTDVIEKLEEINAPVSAQVVNSGNGSLRYRLSLTSSVSGSAGALLIDGDHDFGFTEKTAAQDAAILFGTANNSTGDFFTSSTNTFEDVVAGLDITITGTESEPVTLEVKENTEPLRIALNLVVDQYNKLRDKLKTLDFYDPDTQSKGILFGSAEALRLGTDLPQALTGRHFGLGRFQSLGDFGVTIDDAGKLSFNSARLLERLESDPAAVEKFFTDETIGFSKKLDDRLESLVGRDNSLLVSKAAALSRQSEANATRITYLQERLDVSRLRLLNQFYRMELAISKIQGSNSALTTLQNLAAQFQSGST